MVVRRDTPSDSGDPSLPELAGLGDGDGFGVGVEAGGAGGGADLVFGAGGIDVVFGVEVGTSISLGVGVLTGLATTDVVGFSAGEEDL